MKTGTLPCSPNPEPNACHSTPTTATAATSTARPGRTADLRRTRGAVRVTACCEANSRTDPSRLAAEPIIDYRYQHMTWDTSRMPKGARPHCPERPSASGTARDERGGGGMREPTVVLVGTLDTKGTEYAFLRRRLEDAGVR